jgi:hypothetical protein
MSRLTRTGLAMSLASTLALATPAHAGVCGSGLKLGAENDGPGLSWHCIPDSGRSASSIPRFSGGGGGSNAAAALGGAAAILSIISIFADMVEPTDSNSDMQDDRIGHGVIARDANRQAILAMQQGRFTTASQLFQTAAKEAGLAMEWDDKTTNARNARYAAAQDKLAQGYKLEAQGKIADASRAYLEARMIAPDDARELKDQLSQYNDRLVAGAHSQPRGAAEQAMPTTSQCRYVNNRLVCQ